MPWPLISDFSRMLQNPKVAFRDPALRSCTVEMDNLGQPKARSGNFATVYRGYREDGSEFAIRVFNRKANLRRETYQAKSEYLQQVGVSSLVGFQYDDRGIRSSDGKLYPMLIMEWVPGVTLFEWARDRCHEGYGEALSIAADVWLGIVRELTDHRIVHGDLQHGNVLVSREGHIRLVDYDCMAVPALLGEENFEIGMVPYQHPQRDSRTETFVGLDNFSAIVIYVALRALAATPQLWATYVDAPGYDRLLFRKEDFENPQSSPLYQQLLQSPDPQVRNLTYYLFQLVGYPLRDVPSLDDIILWCYSLDDLIAEKDWDRAVQLVKRMGPEEAIPENLQRDVDRAYERVRLRDALDEAYQAGSEWKVQELYDPELMDDFPAAESLAEKARRAPEVVRLLEQLGTARRFERWDVFRELWNSNHELLNQRPSAARFKEEMKCLRAADAVTSILADGSVDTKTLLRAWKHLQSQGSHPLSNRLEPEVKNYIRRNHAAELIRKWLKTAPSPPTGATDQKLVTEWNNAKLDESGNVADIAGHCQAASQRLQCLTRIRELAAQKASLDGETEIVKLSRELPDSYHPQFTSRLEAARRRIHAYQALVQSLKPPRSDVAIDAAWKQITQAGATSLVGEKIQKRARLAQRRAPLVRSLQAMDDGLSPVELDARLLEIWDDSLLTGCRDTEPWKARANQARARRQTIEQMTEAIENSDGDALLALAAKDCLKDYPLPDDIRAGIDQLAQKQIQAQRQQRQQIVRAMTSNDRTTFVDLYDSQRLREICDELPHHQPLTCQFVEEEILPLGRSGLETVEEDGLQWDESGKATARWQWPDARITTQCHLAVCPEKPGASQQPDDVERLLEATFQAADYDRAGNQFEFAFEAEWDGAHVLVWAVVDLGFHTFYSQPLDLGQLQLQPKKRKRRFFG